MPFLDAPLLTRRSIAKEGLRQRVWRAKTVGAIHQILSVWPAVAKGYGGRGKSLLTVAVDGGVTPRC